MTTLRLPAVLAFSLALAACSGADTQAQHSAPDRSSGHTESSAGLPGGSIEAGAKLAVTKGKSGQACADCHGKDGNSPNAEDVPYLGGQYADYLEHSLQAYRDNRTREHPLMGPQAKDLSDQQIADVAAYFASQPSKLSDLSER